MSIASAPLSHWIARAAWPLAILAAGVSTSPLLSLQARSAQTFRTTTDLVLLDVVVLDEERRPVTGLTAADFTVLDEGERRDIEAFTAVDLPSHALSTGAAWTREVAPEVISNQVADEGRLVVILMDRSISAGPATEVAREIARAAVGGLGPADLAAVVTSSGFATEGMVQNFTHDRPLLLSAIDAPSIGLVSPPQMGPRGLQQVPPDLRHTGDCLCGECVTGALVRVADAMSEVDRRQKILFFIGTDIVIQDPPMGAGLCSLPIKEGRERALRALDRANVTVHSIDPSGLETLARGADSFPGQARDAPARTLQRQGNLAVFPDYTGGRVVLNTNAPSEIVPQIFDETQSYYLIGFERAEEGEPGERREIRVRVNRDDVTVRSRRAYYPVAAAAADRTVEAQPDPVDAALEALLPRTAIPLSMALTLRFAEDGNAMVDLHAAGPVEQAGEQRTFDVAIGVLDDRARALGTERQVVEMPAGATTPLDVHAHLPLGPGRYEVRVAVAERGSERAGSVYGYVTVPDADETAVTLAGVVLATREAARAAGTASTPTVRRLFSRDDAVSALVQVRSSHDPPSDVPVRLGLTDASGRRVADQRGHVSSSACNHAGVAEEVLHVPLEGLTTGEYLLTVEAGGNAAAQRQHVRIEIE